MSDPIRVLQVFGALNRGGSESMIMNLYRNIDRTKVQFDFVKHTSEECAFDDEIKSLGGLIYNAPKFNFVNYLSYRKWWNKFFVSHPEYKIIHGHLFTIASIFFDVAHKYNRKTVGHSHATKSPIFDIKTLFRRPFLNRLGKTSDYRFACSVDAGKWIYKDKDFKVLRNAIDSEKYVYSDEARKKIREKLGVQNNFVVGNIGRLTAQKNQSFLIDVFKKIHERNAKSSLIIVGVGELEQQLKKKVEQYQLDNSVMFLGARADISEILCAMDVFVFPSIYEGLGIVAVEAQAAGLPTICADTIPHEAKITDLVKFLPLSDSAEKWANVVLNEVKKDNRPNTQKEIIKAGYDVNETVKWLERFYTSI